MILLILACVRDVSTDEVVDTGTAAGVEVQALWEGTDLEGERITLEDLVVISPETSDRTVFFVQRIGGGENAGLRVTLRGALNGWPLPIGTPVRLTGDLAYTRGYPTLELTDQDDAEKIGPSVEPIATPWSDGSNLLYALVSAPHLRVTSATDPSGYADTDLGFGFANAFGVTPPGWQTEGGVTGIITDVNRISLRKKTDWTGEFVGNPAVLGSISEIRSGAIADGTYVQLDSVVQITPWSRGNRQSVIQDDEGQGLWVDVEAWGSHESQLGDTLIYIGEVRTDKEGIRLRSWDPVVVLASGTTPLDGSDWTDGMVFETTISDLTGPDDYGERTAADDVIVDDRFQSLVDLADPTVTTGAVRIGTDDVVRFCPFESED